MAPDPQPDHQPDPQPGPQHGPQHIGTVDTNATNSSATKTAMDQLNSQRDTSLAVLSGGDYNRVETDNRVTGLQNKDLYQKSWNFAKNTSKQLCSSPISGGKGKRTRKRKRTYRHKKTKHKRSTRRSCKCRKTRRRRRKSYKKKRR